MFNERRVDVGEYGVAGSADTLYLSMVVACHNEAEGLSELCRRTTVVFDELIKPCELVLVNDGSTDATWQRMLALCATDSRITAINLSRNFGQQAALAAGLAHARGQRVVILDADLQDPPELVYKMLELADNGVDVVHGKRRSRRGEGWFKRASAVGFYWLLEKLSDTPVVRNAGEFRLMSRRVVDAIVGLPEGHRFTRGLATWVGFRQDAIEYDRAERRTGTTHWPTRRMLKFAVDALTGFSTQPLALAAWFGFAVFGLGGALLAWFLASWFMSGSVNGTLGVLAFVSGLSGAQLLFMGIHGAYLGRLYVESRGRPLFIVSDVAGRAGACPTHDGNGHEYDRSASSTAIEAV